MTERSLPIEIQVGGRIWAITFSANGGYIVSGDDEGVRVWQTDNRKQMATMKTGMVNCLAVSKDGKLIAVGTSTGKIIVWDSKTYATVFAHETHRSLYGIDFSPTSTQLVTPSVSGCAIIWDATTGKQVQILLHQTAVTAAKYSPLGDRIATATQDAVQVWDSDDGRLLVDIDVKVVPLFNTGLVWFRNSHLLVVSDGKIRKLDATTGATVLEWPAPDADQFTSVALPTRDEFFACSSRRAVILMNASAHTQLPTIRHAQKISAIALSPDDRFLAIGGDGGKIAVKSLPRVVEPDIRIDDAALELWKQGRLEEAEALFTAGITASQSPDHRLLAIRALARAHLRQWDTAIVDAEEAIEIQPSVIAYIAKSIAHVGNGERHKAYWTCDIASQHIHSSHLSFISLIKAILVFQAGEYRDAILHMDNLIVTVPFNSICYAVQAYMYLLLGSSHVKSGDYTSAIQSFEHAQAQIRHSEGRPLLAVSLISGWNFDGVDTTIHQHLCEALFAAGRAKDASDILLKMVNTSDEEVCMSGPIAKWISDSTQQWLSTPPNGCVPNVAPQGNLATLDATPTPLLREWAKAVLTTREWKDALVVSAGFTFSRVTIYQVLCERFETINRVADAVECFLEMTSELEREIYMSGPITEWVCDFTHRRLFAPENDSGATSNVIQDINGLTLLVSLLREWTRSKLIHDSWKDALNSAVRSTLPRVIIYQVVCEHLETIDRAVDAVECFHQMTSELGDACESGPMTEWVFDFMQRRLSASQSGGDTASTATGHDNTSALHASLTPILRRWVKVKLTRESWQDVLVSAISFTLPRVTIYRVVCEHLGAIDHVTDAVKCFHQMTSELAEEMNLPGDNMEWTLDFCHRSFVKPKHLGNIAMDAQQYDDAISLYSTALSLDSPPPQNVFIKRSMAYMAVRSWQQALNDANQAVTLEPSSPWGYKMKHAALHEAGNYDDAVIALETMLSTIERSPDPDTHQHGDQYVNPGQTRARICKVVQRTLRHSPRMLINTTTGRLYDRAARASAFESLPIFNELVSSMTTHIDRARIKREVRQFRYAMLSHKWEANEPLFQDVIHKAVYDLDGFPTHHKLQMFCKIVQDGGFTWAWSDTCCINKSDHFVLQEALVAMFKWYQGSAMVIVFLRGVCSSSRLGALVRSIWNTRAWTLQEYVASKVVLFYTEDWTPYLNLPLSNHKNSPEIISEMEQATGVFAEQLMSLRPGLTNIREKLRLASTRQTTFVEDAAYSLLGIFSAVGIPAIYGEGEASLGRLLANLLTRSGDLSILAWTGESGPFNSCLPARIAVFNGPTTSHIPPPISDAEMESIVTASHDSLDIDEALRLYDRLKGLPMPKFAETRMTIPCIAFRLPALPAPRRTRSVRIYRVDTVAFGMVEIKTRQDLSRMKHLYLVHPWLDTLLEHEGTRGGAYEEDNMAPQPSPNTDDGEVPDEGDEEDEEPYDEENDEGAGLPYEEIDDDEDDDDSLLEPETPLHPAPSQMIPRPMDKETRARRMVARLRQPFGALLFTLVPTERRMPDYKRVAADSSITVRFKENVSLSDILAKVRVIDVL